MEPIEAGALNLVDGVLANVNGERPTNGYVFDELFNVRGDLAVLVVFFFFLGNDLKLAVFCAVWEDDSVLALECFQDVDCAIK